MVRAEDQIMTKTNATYEATDAHRRTETEEPSGTQTSCCAVVGGVGGFGRLKLVLIARNLIFNSNAAPNYKHMFRPHRGPLTRLLRENKHHSENKSK